MGSWTQEAVRKLINIIYVELRPCTSTALDMGGNLTRVIARAAHCNSYIPPVRSRNRDASGSITIKVRHKYDSRTDRFLRYQAIRNRRTCSLVSVRTRRIIHRFVAGHAHYGYRSVSNSFRGLNSILSQDVNLTRKIVFRQ